MATPVSPEKSFLARGAPAGHSRPGTHTCYGKHMPQLGFTWHPVKDLLLLLGILKFRFIALTCLTFNRGRMGQEREYRRSEMEIEKAETFDWVESSILEEIDVDFTKTFCRDPADSDLQVSRFCERINDIEKDWRGHSVWRNSISSLTELQHFAVSPTPYNFDSQLTRIRSNQTDVSSFPYAKRIHTLGYI